jgi:poly-gamma-glutamate synthesis protein (capsule biosynthesis protein)
MGLAFSGCQDRQVAECSVTTVERAGKRIGLAGYSMVYGTFDLEEAKRQVAELAEATDLAIVNIHWGTEYQHQFGRLQSSIGKALIDAGADIVVGHHPHVVQGMESYKGRPIFYSLGNFIFDQMFSPDTQEGLALALSVDGGRVEAKLLPLSSERIQVKLMADDMRAAFLEKLAGWSAGDEAFKESIHQGRIIFEQQ